MCHAAASSGNVYPYDCTWLWACWQVACSPACLDWVMSTTSTAWASIYLSRWDRSLSTYIPINSFADTFIELLNLQFVGKPTLPPVLQTSKVNHETPLFAKKNVMQVPSRLITDLKVEPLATHMTCTGRFAIGEFVLSCLLGPLCQQALVSLMEIVGWNIFSISRTLMNVLPHKELNK